MLAIVVDRRMASQRGPHRNPGYTAKGDCGTDGIEVPNQLTLQERDDAGLPRGLRSSQRSLNVEVGGRKVSVGVIREKSGTGYCRLRR